MLPRVDLVRTETFDYLLFHCRDHISNVIRSGEQWADTEITLCRYLTTETENAIVIDAGANLGAFALPVARHLDASGGRVYSFEPQRIVFQQLCANVMINSLGNVFAHNVALGDDHGMIEIPELDFSNSFNIGGLSVDPAFRDRIFADAEKGINIKNVVDGRYGNYKVRKIPLDSLELFENVRFIKVDIEGWELEFFRGAVETLRRNNFPPIVFELWPFEWYREKGKETVGFLEHLGYRLTPFDREILAQHPAYERQLRFDAQSGKVSMDIKTQRLSA